MKKLINETHMEIKNAQIDKGIQRRNIHTLWSEKSCQVENLESKKN